MRKKREKLGEKGSTGTNDCAFQKQDGKASTGTAAQGGKATTGTTAVGRRVRFQHLDNTTIPFFFTGFPENAKNSDLWSLFARFGLV